MAKLMETLLVVIYCRVSTVKQGEGVSLDEQERRGRAFVAAKPDLAGCEVVVMVDKESGAFDERTRLDETRELIRQGRVKAVVAYDTDRVVRDPLYVVEFARFCLEHGAVLMFSDGTTVDNKIEELIQFVKGYSAADELAKIRDRSMNAKMAWAERGRFPVGMSRGLYGYRPRADKNGLEIVEEEAEVVRWINKLRLQLVPVYRIAYMLNERGIPTKNGFQWEARQVNSVLRNEAYVGRLYYGKARYEKLAKGKRRVTPKPRSEWKLIEDWAPPILDKSTWNAVQALWKSPQHRKQANCRVYPMTKFMFCGKCGSAMNGRGQKARWFYYHCAGTKDQPKRARICAERAIRAVETEEAVLGCFKEVVKDPSGVVGDFLEYLGTGGGDLGDEIKRLEREIAKCESELRGYSRQNAERMINDKMFNDLAGPLNLLVDKRREEMAALVEQQALRDEGAEIDERMRACFAEYAERIDGLTGEDWKPVLHRFGVKVTATWEGLLVMMTLDPGLFTIEHTLA